jgi:Flp pilus assembly protein TadD
MLFGGITFPLPKVAILLNLVLTSAMFDKRASLVCAIVACLLGAPVKAQGNHPKITGFTDRSSDSDSTALLKIARATRDAGSPAAALDLYRRVAAGATSPAFKVEYGDILIRNGMIDDAIGAYLQVAETSPAAVGAWLGLARCYDRLAQPAKALAYVERAVERSPGDEQVAVAYGVTLDAAGRHEDAQRSYRRALAAAPRSVAVRNDLALSLAVTGKYDEAIDLLTPMVDSADASPRVRQNLALVYGLRGDRAKSIALASTDLGVAAARSNMRLFDLVRSRAAAADKP